MGQIEKNLLNHIKIVLVETKTPGNIGASARAMKTMGINQLCLVNPNGKESGEAQARAVHAYDVLEKAQVCDRLETAVKDCTLVIGTSGKIENIDQTRLSPHSLAESLAQEIEDKQHKNIAIVFGRESRGLTLQELALCHVHVRIPSHPNCPSLNLAAAVQIICYELFMSDMNRTKSLGLNTDRANRRVTLAEQAQQNYLLTQLEALAIKVGALNPKEPRQMMNKFRALIQRSQARKAEIDLFINLIKRITQKL